MSVRGCFAAWLAEENLGHQSRHVERGQHHRGESDIEREVRHRPGVRGMQNGFLAPDSGEEERHTGECHHPDRKRDERHAERAAEAPELTDVLFMMRGVDH